jgi:hypothetical protein
MDLAKHKNDIPILEKIMLAYWYSIPADNDINPESIKIKQDNIGYFTVELFRNNKMYGIACIQKNEIDKYCEKLKGLKEHELDIIDRIEHEVTK